MQRILFYLIRKEEAAAKLLLTHFGPQQKPVLKTFKVAPNSFFKYSKERVRFDLRRLKNRPRARRSNVGLQDPRWMHPVRALATFCNNFCESHKVLALGALFL